MSIFKELEFGEGEREQRGRFSTQNYVSSEPIPQSEDKTNLFLDE